MPLTKTGEKVKSAMAKEYGPEKGKRVFYASMNKGRPGSSKWHKSSGGRSAGLSKRSR